MTFVGRVALPRAFDLSAWAYFLDFFVMPPATLALLWIGISAPVAAVMTAWLFGVVFWSLAEYWIHRVIFHHVAAMQRMHDVHHANPKGLVGVATWGTAVAFVLVWLTASQIAGRELACAFTSGVIAGYLLYIAAHVRFHHGDPARFGRYIAFMARHHNGHHRGARGNFGVSSPIWDVVFRTYRRT